jgi:hypothetical protein
MKNMNEIVWFDKNGFEFAITREFQASMYMWKQHYWPEFKVNGKRFDHDDFRGREAIEEVFGQRMSFQDKHQDLLSDVLIR